MKAVYCVRMAVIVVFVDVVFCVGTVYGLMSLGFCCLDCMFTEERWCSCEGEARMDVIAAVKIVRIVVFFLARLLNDDVIASDVDPDPDPVGSGFIWVCGSGSGSRGIKSLIK